MQRKARADVHPLDIAPFLPRLVAGLGAAVFVWLVAAELGHRLLAVWLRDSAVRFALGAPLGYALLGSLVAFLGLLHAATPKFAIGLCVFIAVVRLPSYIAAIRRLPQGLAALNTWLRKTGLLERASIAVMAFAFLTGLITAALPAVWWDPIAYHLQIAATALASGSFAFDPGMVQSAFPSLGEAAALPAYAMAGSAGAAMTTLLAGVALALICALLAHRTAPGTGLLAGALVMSSALWLWIAPSFYVDVPFALFVVAAIGTPLLVQTEASAGRINSTATHAPTTATYAPTTATGRINSTATYALVTGVLCGALVGAAAATKYLGLIAGLIVLAELFALAPRPRSFALGAFAAGFVALAVGWYARNFAQIGDPVYPFLTGALGFPVAIQTFTDRYIGMTRGWCGAPSGAIDLVLLAWRLLVDPRTFCGDQGFALRLGAIFAVVGIVAVRRSRPIGIAVVALTIAWYFSDQEWRFLLPALALYAVLVAAGTAGATDRLRTVGAGILIFLGAAGITVNWLAGTINQASSSIVPGYAYIAARETAGGYLERRLETFGASEWLAARGAKPGSVISLDDVRTYYFWGGIAWANPFYQQEWTVDWTLPANQRYAELRAHHFRYVLVNAAPEYVHRTPTGVVWDALADDVKRGALSLAYQADGVTLYEIK